MKIDLESGIIILGEALPLISKTGQRRTRVFAKCFCGKIFTPHLSSLVNNNTKSCGCLKKKKKKTKYDGLTKEQPKLYAVWKNMIQRCYKEKNPNYKYYGARGITVCEEWKDNFTAFVEWALKNGFKEELLIDREENDGNYEPSNCRFVTPLVSASNKRKTPATPRIKVVYKGREISLKQLAADTGISFGTLSNRIFKKKMSVESAVIYSSRNKTIDINWEIVRQIREKMKQEGRKWVWLIKKLKERFDIEISSSEFSFRISGKKPFTPPEESAILSILGLCK